MGVDVEDVVAGVAQDPRIGSHFFRPGIGYGGSCLPKDTASLRFMGDTFGVPTPFLAAVQQVNENARTRTVRRLREALGTLEGQSHRGLGPDLQGRHRGHATVAGGGGRAAAGERGCGRHGLRSLRAGRVAAAPELQISLAATALEAVEDADALAVLTDWREFTSVPLDEVAARMRGRRGPRWSQRP